MSAYYKFLCNEDYGFSEMFDNIFENGLWTTKDGRKIKLCDMTNSHFTNACNYAIREWDFTDSMIDKMKSIRKEQK